jgi:hypothetical protein
MDPSPLRDLPALSDVSAVAQVIQLSVAPVFLLSGIGAMLAVMTNRLSRVIDRARHLETIIDGATAEGRSAAFAELKLLSQRAKYVGRAITFCTITALLVCTVIAILFLSAFLHFKAGIAVALLFIAAMVAFFLGLLWFLREIFVATGSLRIGPQ